jgi:hypothetical protein
MYFSPNFDCQADTSSPSEKLWAQLVDEFRILETRVALSDQLPPPSPALGVLVAKSSLPTLKQQARQILQQAEAAEKRWSDLLVTIRTPSDRPDSWETSKRVKMEDEARTSTSQPEDTNMVAENGPKVIPYAEYRKMSHLNTAKAALESHQQYATTGFVFFREKKTTPQLYLLSALYR